MYAGRGRSQPAKRRRSPLAPIGQRGTTRHPTTPEQWILVGQIPALISQERFEQVQAKLRTNQQFARRNNKAHSYLLRALVSCGLCRMSCAGQTRDRYSYYTCAAKMHPSRTGREQGCPSRLIPMRQLDEVVWADLCELLMHPETIRQALGRAKTRRMAPAGDASTSYFVKQGKREPFPAGGSVDRSVPGADCFSGRIPSATPGRGKSGRSP